MEKKNQLKVGVDFGVIYRRKQKIEMHNYLDFKHLKDIWGIALAGVKISLKQPCSAHYKAKAKAYQNQEKLLSLQQWQTVYNNLEAFNSALRFLNQNGVLAPIIEKVQYWSADEDDAQTAWTFHLETGCRFRTEKDYARLVRTTL